MTFYILQIRNGDSTRLIVDSPRLGDIMETIDDIFKAKYFKCIGMRKWMDSCRNVLTITEEDVV